jgi:hypothetical protein
MVITHSFKRNSYELKNHPLDGISMKKQFIIKKEGKE